MRKLLTLAVIVLIAMLCGWLTFERSSGKASFTLDTTEMTEDAKEFYEQGKRIWENADSGRELEGQ
jgi:hypothetical protein